MKLLLRMTHQAHATQTRHMIQVHRIKDNMTNDVVGEDTPFLTADKFYKMIDDLVWEEDISYIEATISICTLLLIDPEDINKLKLVSPILKVKLHTDGMNEGMLRREAQLPI